MRTALFGFVLLAGGCLASGRVGYSAAVVAPAPAVVVETAPPPPPPTTEVVVEPDLVEVSPGVQVIADYDEPVFFSDGLYWRNDGGVWYSSRVHTGGWGRVEVVPAHVRGIERPAEYRHYRPAGYVPRAQRGPEVRDHREGGRPAVAPGPAVRDHREVAAPPGPVVHDHREVPPHHEGPGAPVEPVREPHREGPTPPAHGGTVGAPPQPAVREPAPHRAAPPPPPPAHPAPVVRDHRDDKKK